jgi:type I restriction enzyme R subunit
MPHAYTEDQLVEQPAIGLFAELGWQTVSALEETFSATGTLLRETKGEVVLVSRLRAALERLNPTLPPEAITAAVDELTRDRSAMLKHQIQNLRRTRDLLLPRLRSGQVELGA